MKIKCQNCGTETELGNIFCKACGAKIDISANDPRLKRKRFKFHFPKINFHVLFFLLAAAAVYMETCRPYFTQKVVPYVPDDKEDALQIMARIRRELGREITKDSKAVKRKPIKITCGQLAYLAAAYLPGNPAPVQKTAKKGKGKKAEDRDPYNDQGNDILPKIIKGNECAARLNDKGHIELTTMGRCLGLTCPYTLVIDPVRKEIISTRIGDIPLFFGSKKYALECFEKLYGCDFVKELLSRLSSVELNDGKIFLQIAPKIAGSENK